MSVPQAKLTPEELLQSAVGLTGTVERLAAENVRLKARVKPVSVSVASGRGVAERWRTQYQHDGKWTRTAKDSGEVIYNALCDLGDNPDIEAVAKAIGNQSWSYLTCSGCNDYVTRAADFSDNYSDHEIKLCQACLEDGLGALTKTQ